MRYFTRFSIKIHLEDSVYSLDDDCIELQIECHFVVRYFHKTSLKTDVEPNLNRLKFLKNSDRTFPLLTRPSIKDQK